MMLCLLLSILPVWARRKTTTVQACFAPFPKAGDKYWRKQVPEAMRKDYIRLGDSCVNMPWEAIPNKVFAEFRTTGNRTHYEEMSFDIRLAHTGSIESSRHSIIKILVLFIVFFIVSSFLPANLHNNLLN